MADDGLPDHQPCWCTALPPVVPVPGTDTAGAGCWCPACLRAQVDAIAAAKGSDPRV
jgi:hypothetical protein